MSDVASLRLRDVELRGQRVDVDVVDGMVVAIELVGTSGSALGEAVDGRGGALLPGLHDHHLHLMAMAAQAHSVDCGPDMVADLAALGAQLRGAVHHHPDGWVRGTGYHESVGGELDRDVVDALVADVPVRIQHRSGALWILNSAALARLPGIADLGESEGVERDSTGRVTGRLWRMDGALAALFPTRPPDLAIVGERLRGLGLTGVTDATPDLPDSTVQLISSAVDAGRLPVRVMLLGAEDASTLMCGPAKILLPDHDLPDYASLCEMIRSQHDRGRAVAVHCVTRESLVLTAAALREVGTHAGDRIEHAAVVPADLVPLLVRLGIRVVTQPDFLRTRGDAYLRDVAAHDVSCLYPHRSLVMAGVPTAASSDAPFGELDPWRVIASAVERRTAGGRVMGPEESVGAATALAGYLSAPATPGGAPRRVSVGDPADLMLLDVSVAAMLARPEAHHVVATVLGRDVRSRSQLS